MKIGRTHRARPSIAPQHGARGRLARARHAITPLVLIATALLTSPGRAEGTLSEERLRELEERVKKMDAITSRLQEVEGELATVKEKLATYEAAEAERADHFEALRQSKEEMLAYLGDKHQPYGSGFDFHVWGWLGLWAETSDDWRPWLEAELQLNFTKAFSDRFSVAADISFIESFNKSSADVAQLFASWVVSPEHETLLTAGKFNTPFGTEHRDAWFRSATTPSVIFDAYPRDLRGVMVTQPLGDSGFTLRPFAVAGFADDMRSTNYPSAGVMIEYQFNENLTAAVTPWAGPEYGGMRSDSFVVTVAQLEWKLPPRAAVRLEGVYGTRDLDEDEDQVWVGALAELDYDLTDRLRAYGQYSFVHDPDGVVTGAAQDRHGVTIGLGYELFENVELRGEYHHGFSDAIPDLDRVSVDLMFAF